MGTRVRAATRETRRRAAAHVPAGLRRHHLRQPATIPTSAAWPEQIDWRGLQGPAGFPGLCSPRIPISRQNDAALAAALSAWPRPACHLRRHVAIERAAFASALLRVLGKEAMFYTTGAGAGDVRRRHRDRPGDGAGPPRDRERRTWSIALDSHGGVAQGKDGSYTEGDAAILAKESAGLHRRGGRRLSQPPPSCERQSSSSAARPLFQTGKEGQNLASRRLQLDGAVPEGRVLSGFTRSTTTVAGDRAIADDIEELEMSVTGGRASRRAVTASTSPWRS